MAGDTSAVATSAVTRGAWSNACQFFITNLGFAVGLGNIWRFPSVVYRNGGAVFFIPYILCLIFIAIPMLLLEGIIGQWSKKGPIDVWQMSPVWRGVGYAILYYAVIHVVYYNTPISWGAYYFFNAMQTTAPWSTCDGYWASSTCTTNETLLALNKSIAHYTSPAQDFFENGVLHQSMGVTDWGDFAWQVFCCNAFAWVLIFGGICLGAASLGKIAYFTTFFPYLTLFGLLGYSATLPGAVDGIEFYITRFEFDKLADIRVWRAAMAQVFFSTNCGFGGVIQLASYNRFRHGIFRDSIIIPILDGLTSLMGGFVVFAALGYMAHIRNARIEDVIQAGPGLIFVTYAEAFNTIEGGNIVAIFFFFMIMLLGLSSQLPNIEMLCGCIGDEFPWFKGSRMRNMSLRFVFCLSCFALGTFFYFGNGYFWYYLIDERVAGIPLLITGLFEMIGVAWIYNRPFVRDQLLRDLEEMLGPVKYSRWFWIICWTFIAPLALAVILVYDLVTTSPLVLEDKTRGDYFYPEWTAGISWALLSLTPIIIAVSALATVCWKYGAYKSCVQSCLPTEEWKAAPDPEEDPQQQRVEGSRPDSAYGSSGNVVEMQTISARAPVSPDGQPPPYIPYTAMLAPNMAKIAAGIPDSNSERPSEQTEEWRVDC